MVLLFWAFETLVVRLKITSPLFTSAELEAGILQQFGDDLFNGCFLEIEIIDGVLCHIVLIEGDGHAALCLQLFEAGAERFVIVPDGHSFFPDALCGSQLG